MAYIKYDKLTYAHIIRPYAIQSTRMIHTDIIIGRCATKKQAYSLLRVKCMETHEL